MRQLQVAPGFREGVPVDSQARIGRRRIGNEVRNDAAQHGQADASDTDLERANFRHRDEQAARHIAQQDGHEGAHLHHAVAARQLALAQVMRQVGELHGAEQRGVQSHQEGAAQESGNIGGEEAPGRQRHDEDLQALDEEDQLALVVLVRQLAAGRGEQQEREDEQCADHQAGHRRRQPGDLQLVGHHHRERELEQVVVGGAGELGPEEGREAALLEQGELVGMRLRVDVGRSPGDNSVRVHTELLQAMPAGFCPDLRRFGLSKT
jgi:hypothetical protein